MKDAAPRGAGDEEMRGGGGEKGGSSVAAAGLLRAQLGKVRVEIVREEEAERELVQKLQVRILNRLQVVQTSTATLQPSETLFLTDFPIVFLLISMLACYNYLKQYLFLTEFSIEFCIFKKFLC